MCIPIRVLLCDKRCECIAPILFEDLYQIVKVIEKRGECVDTSEELLSKLERESIISLCHCTSFVHWFDNNS